MTGKPQAGDAELIVYVDHSDIHEGRLEDLKEGIRRLVDVIEALEPQLIAYGFHLDEESGRMTVTAVHPDSRVTRGVTVSERFAGFARTPRDNQR